MLSAGFSANVAALAAVVTALGDLPVASAGFGMDDFLHGSLLVLLAFVWIRRLTRIATSPYFFTIIGISAVIIGGASWVRTHPLQFSTSPPSAPQMQEVESVVTNYMLSRASSPSSIQFLEWSDLRKGGTDCLVTLRYSAIQRSGERTTATVRFTVRNGAVANAQVLKQG